MTARRQTSNGTRARAARLSVAATVLLSVASSWALGPPVVDPSPANATGVRRQRSFDFRAGLDLSKFRRVQGEGRVALTGDLTRDGERRTEACERAFQDAFRKIETLDGLRYSRSLARYREAFRAFVERRDRQILQRDIRPLRQHDAEDYDRREYKCYFEIGVRAEPQLAELDDALDAAVSAYLGGLPSGDTLSINLSDVLAHVTRDPDFSRRVRGVVSDERRMEPFRYKDDDTQVFLEGVASGRVEISHYDAGQYLPNAVLTALIARGVRPKVVAFLERYARVGVRCIGSADRLPIRHGLDYGGSARLLKGEGLELDSKSGRPLRPRLRDNDDLSFARAYEALAVLADSLPRPARLSLRYVGRGEAAGAPRAADPLSRKITFEIRGLP